MDLVENNGIKFTLLEEAGYEQALRGLALNKNQKKENMPKVAEKLAPLGNGHNKFLESIVTWIEVKAPRYIWQDLDTYRLTTKQSQSTNHTIMKEPLNKNHFEAGDISDDYLKELNKLIQDNNFIRLKRKLPEGFLQKRVWVLNYKNLRDIITQRTNHKLYILRYFCQWILDNVEHPKLLKIQAE